MAERKGDFESLSEFHFVLRSAEDERLDIVSAAFDLGLGQEAVGVRLVVELDVFVNVL